MMDEMKGTERGDKLIHTYSIVASDEETGDMGVAVQSHWFSVGTVVTWGEAGVGVVATQSMVNPSFGPRGLDMLKQGTSAKSAVSRLIESDEGRDWRQLAILDSRGRVAAYTGRKCVAAAGHIVGKNFSAQANMMLNDQVWPAMSQAFRASKGPLAERLLKALEAAEKAGGDIRGRQSAAILVVRGEPTGKIWEDRLVDLRVDDNARPLAELKRLLRVHKAYEHMNRGDLAMEKDDMHLAMEHYAMAEKLFPRNEEMRFWHAVTLANNGKIKEASLIFKEVFDKNKNWRELTTRLVPVGLLRVDKNELRSILRKGSMD